MKGVSFLSSLLSKLSNQTVALYDSPPPFFFFGFTLIFNLPVSPSLQIWISTVQLFLYFLKKDILHSRKD